MFTHVCICMNTPDICVCASPNFHIVLYILTGVCATTLLWQTPQTGFSSSEILDCSFFFTSFQVFHLLIPFLFLSPFSSPFLFFFLRRYFVLPYFFFSFYLKLYYSSYIFYLFSFMFPFHHPTVLYSYSPALKKILLWFPSFSLPAFLIHFFYPFSFTPVLYILPPLLSLIIFSCFLFFSFLFRGIRIVANSACYLLYVRPSARVYQRSSLWTYFREIYYWGLLSKSVKGLRIWLKSDKNTGLYAGGP